MGILSELEPQAVFHYFEEICRIPHGSGNTKAISDYCVQFAKEHQLRYRQDAKNNIILFQDGTPGYENAAPVMLQGHLDMVCEKEPGASIDMTTEGLSLELSDNQISAKDTTLGGDDGIAVAYALAILASDEIAHPPLEVVLTVDEEIGMLGAAALDCSCLRARTMLNLDSEDEGYLLVSCAGGVTAVGHLPVTAETVTGYPYTLSVKGLLGGHSGVEIDKGRANACCLLGRILYELSRTAAFRLVAVNGGQKDNAIPREAAADLVFLSQQDVDAVQQEIGRLEIALRQEYALTDPDIHVFLTAKDTAAKKDASLPAACSALTEHSAQKAIAALFCLPGGVQRMSRAIEGLVQTSLNLGILATTEQEICFSFSVRSSVETEKQALVRRIECLMTSLGGSLTTSGAYPAWEYRQDSPLRDLMVRIFEEQYGKKPVVQALHAGVECGLFAGKLPGLDCVSFGPDMKDIHTTKESMDVASVQRTWRYLLEILRQLH